MLNCLVVKRNRIIGVGSLLAVLMLLGLTLVPFSRAQEEASSKMQSETENTSSKIEKNVFRFGQTFDFFSQLENNQSEKHFSSAEVGSESDTSSSKRSSLAEQSNTSPTAECQGLFTPTGTRSPALNFTNFCEAYPESDRPLGNRTPVILIHGIHGNSDPDTDTDLALFPYKHYFRGLIEALEKNTTYNNSDKYKTYKFHYQSDKYSTENIAWALAQRIDQAFGPNKKVIFIAHSMGGIVARHYMAYKTGGSGPGLGERVSKLITLATPHHGTKLANGAARASYLTPAVLDTAVYYALDRLYWGGINSCEACVSSLQAHNRGTLLWNNFDTKWNDNFLYQIDPNEKNKEMPKSHLYGHKIIAYYGKIEQGLIPDLPLRGVNKIRRRLLDDFGLKVTGNILNFIEVGQFTTLPLLENDGFVSLDSGKFASPPGQPKLVDKVIFCENHNHREMKDGTNGKCSDGNVKIRLFDSILSSLGITVSFTENSVTSAPGLITGPAEVSFGNVSLSGTVPLIEQERIIPLSNVGDSAVQITGLGLTGTDTNQFQILNAPILPVTVAPDSRLNIKLRFTPNSTGNKTVNLMVTTNVPNNNFPIYVNGFGLPASCIPVFSPQSRSMPVGSGNGIFTIGTMPCPWEISTNDSWITANTSGNTVNFAVSGNTTGATRMGKILVSVYGFVFPFTIAQVSSSSGCQVNLANESVQLESNSGGGSVSVMTPDNCSWGIQSGSPWITVINPVFSAGDRQVNFTVTPNTSSATRYGTIIVEGEDITRTFTVTQAGSTSGGGSCNFTLSSNSQNFPVGGGNNSVSLTTGSNCQWRLATADRWITFNSANNGTGSATINYSVNSNTSSLVRYASIFVNGNGPSAELSISQQGTPVFYPAINLPVTNANAGEALVNTSIYQSFVVRNTGPGYMNVTSVYRSSGSQEFEVLPYTDMVYSGESTSITVKFTPISTGLKSAVFTVSTNDPNNPLATVTVSGTGVTQITGGIDFVWTNRFTVPNTASVNFLTGATVGNNIYTFNGGGYKYDPTINLWSVIADQPSGQFGGATVINGTTYLVGFGGGVTRVQSYNPVNNTWTQGATMPAVRLDMGVASANGKIYVFGGRDGSGGNAQTTSSVYEYTPSTNTWVTKANMPTARLGATAVAFSDGLIYVIGGRTTNQTLRIVEVYNPVSNTWTTREAMPSPRAFATGFILNNKIFVAGGDGNYLGQGGNSRYDLVEEFDPAKPDSTIPGIRNAWSLRNPLLAGRLQLASGIVNNKAYIIGGTNTSGNAVYTVEEGVLGASPRFNMPVKDQNLGSVSVGSINEKSIEVQNTGNALLTVSSITRISGSTDFSVYRGIQNMVGGESINFRMRFTPTGTGIKTAVFRITSNDPDNPTVDFTLSGTGQTASPENGASWQFVRSFPLQDTGNSRSIAVKNGKAYVTRNYSTGIGLDVIDISSGSRLANIPVNNFQAGSYSGDYLEVYGNQAYFSVNNLGSQGKLAVINLNTNTNTASPVTGGNSNGIASNGTNVYVSVGNSVKVVNVANNNVVATIPVGLNPTQVVFDPNTAKIYVANSGSSTNELQRNDVNKSLSIIDPTTNTVIATVPLQYQPFSVAVTGNRAYVSTTSTVEVVDLTSNTVVASIAVPRYSGNMVTSGGYILVQNNTAVTIIKAETNEIVGYLNLGTSEASIALDSDTGIVYVLNNVTRIVSAYRLITPAYSVVTNNQNVASNAGGNTILATTVSSFDGWTGAVTLSCEGLPTGGTCQFTQNPVTLSANGTVSTNVTVSVPSGTVSGIYSLKVVGNGASTNLLATDQTDSLSNISLTVPTANVVECSYTINPTSANVGGTGESGGSGGTGSFAVTAPNGCAWSAVSSQPAGWLTTGGTGSGNGTVNYAYIRNQGEPRTGTINIVANGITQATHTVNQSAMTVPVTIRTNPVGLSFTANGTTYTTTQTFEWTAGSTLPVSTTSPQAGTAGTQYVWSNWSDGGAISHNVFASPSGGNSYTANFNTQYQLTMNAGTGGTVSPSSGGFYNAGETVQVLATPTGGFTFAGWSGTGSGSYSGTNNPATVTMNAPLTQTAIFNQAAVPVGVVVPTGLTGRNGSTITVPVNVTTTTTGRGITSFDFDLNYTDSVLTAPITVGTSGTMSDGWSIFANVSSPGVLSVSGSSSSPLVGSGTLLNLTFTVNGLSPNCSNLEFAGNNVSFGSSQSVPATTTNGQACVVAGTIGGIVTYGNAIGSPVPPRFVSNVLLTAADTPNVLPDITATTDSFGAYLLSGFASGSYLVTPTKANQPNSGGFILTNDATAIQRARVGLDPALTGNRRIAADVNRNGFVTSFDASLIQQFRVSINNAENFTGTWVFVNATNNYPNPAQSNATTDYQAILLGDVSGNWAPPAMFATSVFAENLLAPVSVTLPTETRGTNTTFNIPITVSSLTGENVTSFDFDLIYNPAVIEPQAPYFNSTGTVSSSCVILANPVAPNKVSVSASCINPLVGGGTLINLPFRTIGAAGTNSPLSFELFDFGGSTSTITVTNGRINVSASTAATVSVGGRILTAEGRGIRNVRVSMTDKNGNTQTAISSSLGYYRFEDVPVGETYIFSVTARQYNFVQSTQVVAIQENTDNLNFVADTP